MSTQTTRGMRPSIGNDGGRAHGILAAMQAHAANLTKAGGAQQ